VERDTEDTTLSGAATGNAVLSTVCKWTEGTAKRSVTSERSARQAGMSATQTNAEESLVRQHGHLVLVALWNSQPVEADESVSDVVTQTQAINEINEPCSPI